jgi:hypothetical protein
VGTFLELGKLENPPSYGSQFELGKHVSMS